MFASTVLVLLSLSLAAAEAEFEIKLPNQTLCSITGGSYCQDYMVVEGHIPRQWPSRGFIMTIPDIPVEVNTITFLWRRVSMENVFYDVSLQSKLPDFMMPPSFQQTPLRGVLPRNWTDVHLTFNCIGAMASEVPFTIKACFNSSCAKATFRKRCPMQQRKCSLTCENGGVCHPKYGKEKCVCPKGFAGRRCEHHLKSRKPCLVRCSPEGTASCKSYRCNCRYGFKGVYCQHRARGLFAKPCKMPCFNGGMCSLSKGKCICPHPFTGLFCHKKPAPKPSLAILGLQQYSAGETVLFFCITKNINRPTIRWYYVDGINASQSLDQQSSRTHVVAVRGALLIKRVSFNDEGEYLCEVTSPSSQSMRASKILLISRESSEESGSGSGSEDGDGDEEIGGVE